MDKYILSGLDLYTIEIALSQEIDTETDEKSRNYKISLLKKIGKIGESMQFNQMTATFQNQAILEIIPRHEDDIERASSRLK